MTKHRYITVSIVYISTILSFALCNMTDLYNANHKMAIFANYSSTVSKLTHYDASRHYLFGVNNIYDLYNGAKFAIEGDSRYPNDSTDYVRQKHWSDLYVKQNLHRLLIFAPELPEPLRISPWLHLSSYIWSVFSNQEYIQPRERLEPSPYLSFFWVIFPIAHVITVRYILTSMAAKARVHFNIRYIARRAIIYSFIISVPYLSVSCCVARYWYYMSYWNAPIINSSGTGFFAVVAILAGLVTTYAASIAIVSITMGLRHGLYRPSREDRCANCRYALPAAGSASGPTEGPGVGPSAESAAGPTAEPCPECGWDRVSVPKRAWRNLRRFAFGALALTVFFYLGPLWISWLAVIL